MRLWPFQRKPETRASSYTDALIAALTANAGGQTTAFATATAALEAAAGFVGRAFASAEVSGPDVMRRALTPACLAMIGRALIRRGEFVALIRVTSSGQVQLLPAADHDIEGGPDPTAWRYRLNLGGPSRTMTVSDLNAEGLVHVAYARDPEQPWRGLSPLAVAQLGGRLSAETTAALADESSGPRANLLPVPTDGADDTVGPLKADIRKAAGAALLVEAGDWDRAGGGTQSTWMARRLGPAPPAALVELHQNATREIWAACGLSAALFEVGAGAAGREAYRQAITVLVAPLGVLVADELSRKLEVDINLDWRELRAADIAGRARAFASMVSSGLSMESAAAASGILNAES